MVYQVAVKEFNSGHYIGETVLITTSIYIYTHAPIMVT